jgi:hypothetical protein
MNKILVLIVSIVAIAAIAYLFFTMTYIRESPPIIMPDDQCDFSGGTVVTQLCCGSASDFPNMCTIGACGCSADNSHQVKVCDCGQGKCWDSEKKACV